MHFELICPCYGPDRGVRAGVDIEEMTQADADGLEAAIAAMPDDEPFPSWLPNKTPLGAGR